MHSYCVIIKKKVNCLGNSYLNGNNAIYHKLQLWPLTEDWNSGIHYDSFYRLKICSRISFLSQAFELLSVDRLQG